MADPFLLMAEREEHLRGTVRRTLGEHTGGVLLLACLLLTAALPLVVLRLVNPFSEGFLLRTAYTALTSTLAYLLFIPEGRRGVRLRESMVATAEKRLAALSSLVREGHLTAFCEFCHAVGERETAAAQRALLASAGEGEGRRARAARRRAARLRVRPVSPSLVLCGEGRRELGDVGRRHPSFAVRGAILRPLTVLASSLLFSSVCILPGAPLTAATAVEILTGLFGVVMAAFAGYAAGGAAERCTLAVTERRILFLSSFLEEAGISPSL